MRGAWSKTCLWLLDDLTRDANVQGTRNRSLDLSASRERLCRAKVDVSTGLKLSTELSSQWVSKIPYTRGRQIEMVAEKTYI